MSKVPTSTDIFLESARLSSGPILGELLLNHVLVGDSERVSFDQGAGGALQWGTKTVDVISKIKFI